MKKLKSEKGFAVLTFVIIMAVIIPVYFLSSNSYITGLSKTRADSRMDLQTREMFQQSANLIQDAYLRAKSNSCANIQTTTLRTRNGRDYSFSFCNLSSACIVNTQNENDKLCLGFSQNSRVQIQGSMDIPNQSFPEDFLEPNTQPHAKFGIAAAEAVSPAAAAGYLPTIPAVAPYAKFSNVGATPFECDGVDHICMKLRICLKSSCSSVGDYYQQRIAFRP